ARGVAVAGRPEERVGLVDAVVDDADLDPVTLRSRRAVEDVSADDRRAAVEQEREADARVDLGDEAELDEPRQVPGGEAHRDAVEQDPEAAREARLRDRPAELGDGGALRRGDAREVRAREGAADIEAA